MFQATKKKNSFRHIPNLTDAPGDLKIKPPEVVMPVMSKHRTKTLSSEFANSLRLEEENLQLENKLKEDYKEQKKEDTKKDVADEESLSFIDNLVLRFGAPKALLSEKKKDKEAASSMKKAVEDFDKSIAEIDAKIAKLNKDLDTAIKQLESKRRTITLFAAEKKKQNKKGYKNDAVYKLLGIEIESLTYTTQQIYNELRILLNEKSGIMRVKIKIINDPIMKPRVTIEEKLDKKLTELNRPPISRKMAKISKFEQKLETSASMAAVIPNEIDSVEHMFSTAVNSILMECEQEAEEIARRDTYALEVYDVLDNNDSTTSSSPPPQQAPVSQPKTQVFETFDQNKTETPNESKQHIETLPEKKIVVEELIPLSEEEVNLSDIDEDEQRL